MPRWPLGRADISVSLQLTQGDLGLAPSMASGHQTADAVGAPPERRFTRPDSAQHRRGRYRVGAWGLWLNRAVSSLKEKPIALIGPGALKGTPVFTVLHSCLRREDVLGFSDFKVGEDPGHP